MLLTCVIVEFTGDFELFDEASAEVLFVLVLHFNFALDAEFFEFECGTGSSCFDGEEMNAM